LQTLQFTVGGGRKITLESVIIRACGWTIAMSIYTKLAYLRCVLISA